MLLVDFTTEVERLNGHSEKSSCKRLSHDHVISVMSWLPDTPA